MWAIGDCLAGQQELTPVAIKHGKWLADKLSNDERLGFSTKWVPTAMFTWPEYGCCGFSEEKAVSKYGRSNVKCYHLKNSLLESELGASPFTNYFKVVCMTDEKNAKD